MRRALAILALLATSWPHVVALECALGSSPLSDGVPAHQHESAPAHGGAGHDHAMASGAVDASESPVGALPCAKVMACGLVMMEARAATALSQQSSTADALRFVERSAPDAAELAADPPPPRRAA